MGCHSNPPVQFLNLRTVTLRMPDGESAVIYTCTQRTLEGHANSVWMIVIPNTTLLIRPVPISAVARTVDIRNIPKTLNRHRNPTKLMPGKCESSSCIHAEEKSVVCVCSSDCIKGDVFQRCIRTAFGSSPQFRHRSRQSTDILLFWWRS